MNHILDTKW